MQLCCWLPQPVVGPDPAPFACHPAGILQIGQVTGDRGLGHVQARHQLADATFTVQKHGDDPESHWFGKGFEELCCWLHIRLCIRIGRYCQSKKAASGQATGGCWRAVGEQEKDAALSEPGHTTVPGPRVRRHAGRGGPSLRSLAAYLLLFHPTRAPDLASSGAKQRSFRSAFKDGQAVVGPARCLRGRGGDCCWRPRDESRPLPASSRQQVVPRRPRPPGPADRRRGRADGQWP